MSDAQRLADSSSSADAPSDPWDSPVRRAVVEHLNYTVVSRWNELSPAAVKMLCWLGYLLTHSDYEDVALVRPESIDSDVGLTADTVEQALDELIALRVIESADELRFRERARRPFRILIEGLNAEEPPPAP